VCACVRVFVGMDETSIHLSTGMVSWVRVYMYM